MEWMLRHADEQPVGGDDVRAVLKPVHRRLMDPEEFAGRFQDLVELYRVQAEALRDEFLKQRIFQSEACGNPTG
jgi:hypothetical protein